MEAAIGSGRVRIPLYSNPNPNPLRLPLLDPTRPPLWTGPGHVHIRCTHHVNRYNIYYKDSYPTHCRQVQSGLGPGSVRIFKFILKDKQTLLNKKGTKKGNRQTITHKIQE